MSGKVVTYLDFGTAHVHLARRDGTQPPAIALCGLGAALPVDAPCPGSFDDRPGLYPAELCKRCKKLATDKGEARA